MEMKKRKRTLKKVCLSLFLLLAVCSSTWLNQNADAQSEADLQPTDLDRVHEGIPAPDFTLESKDSEPITLSSYQGKKNVVLVFYRGYW